MRPYLFMSPMLPVLVLAGLLAGVLSGCMMDPMTPSPLYSRLPAAQNQAAQPLSPQEQQKYNQIDQQVLAAPQQSMAADAAAQAYRAPVPVTVYGGYGGYGGYSSGGWGNRNRWNSGVSVGYGYGPYW